MTGLWAKALDAAEEAHLLLRERRYDGAASRAYYAMFNVARALLVQDGVDMERIKTHGSVLRLFSRRLVGREGIDHDLGRAFNRAAETRQTADYDVISVTEEEARDRVAAMDRLIEAGGALLGEGDKR